MSLVWRVKNYITVCSILRAWCASESIDIIIEMERAYGVQLDCSVIKHDWECDVWEGSDRNDDAQQERCGCVGVNHKDGVMDREMTSCMR